MSRELEEKNTGLPAEYTDMSEWGEQIVTSKDIIISKLLVAQHMSEVIAEKTHMYGDIYDSVQKEVLGNPNEPIEFIPFHMEKYWYEFDINSKGKREFKQVLPVQDNPLKEGYNDDLPYKQEDGKLERDRVMLFYVLLTSKLEIGISLPYVLDFRRTSLKAGKKLATMMYVNNRAEGLVPPAKALELSVKNTSNDDGSFMVQDVKAVRPSTKAEIAECLKWFKMIKAGQAKIDHEKETQEPAQRNVSEENKDKF